MGRKTVKLTKEAIQELPNDKPAMYKILSSKGKNVYTGSAKRGRVRERLLEHLPKGPDPIPGVKVQIEQLDSINAAKEKEKRVIKIVNPRYNKK
jgi:hypothetical protein